MKDKASINNPKTYDIGNKGFLSYEEYVGYCVGMLKQPLDKKVTGNEIQYNEIKFRENKTEIEGVFEFLSNNKEKISFETLKSAVAKINLEIDDTVLNEMLHFVCEGGEVTEKEFKEIFE